METTNASIMMFSILGIGLFGLFTALVSVYTIFRLVSWPIRFFAKSIIKMLRAFK